MDVVVSGRHCEVTDEFREHVEDKLQRLEKLDHRLIRLEVQVTKQQSRQPDRAMKVELTAKSRGPVVRAEACAEEKHAALEMALDRMVAQLRKAADRRKVHRGHHTPESVRRPVTEPDLAEADGTDPHSEPEAPAERKVGPVTVTGEGPLVVREKTHAATPITTEQALYEMELVGHDFYLFMDKETERPCVVYRRHGYDYGVISLDLS